MPKTKKSAPVAKSPQAQADALFDSKKYSEAKALYLIAAEQGNVSAKNSLGIIAFINEKYVEAAQYFYEAMQKGDSDGFHNLAVCYEQGLGVMVSIQYALHFYAQAALLGNELGFASLTDYYKTLGEQLATTLLAATPDQHIQIIETEITSALVPDAIMSAFQLLKHPANRKVVTGILRYAQKSLSKSDSENSLPLISLLFRYEFAICDVKKSDHLNLQFIWGKTYDLMKKIKQYENQLTASALSSKKIFESIIRSAGLELLTKEQRNQIYADFLLEIEHPEWNLSSQSKNVALLFANNIKGGNPQVDITEIFDTSNEVDDQFVKAVITRLPFRANITIKQLLTHDQNREIVKSIIYEAVLKLFNNMSKGNAIKLIALMEFKEKIFSLEIAPLLLMKILSDLNLVCSTNMQWLLERVENTDCTKVNNPNGFYTIMNRVVAYAGNQADNMLEELSLALSSIVVAIHATPRSNFLWNHARFVIASYRNALIAYIYNRNQQIHPLVAAILTQENLSDKQKWPEIYKSMPLPPAGVSGFTFTSNAIWFVTACMSTKLIDLKDQTNRFNSHEPHLITFIELYDVYLKQVQKGTSTQALQTQLLNQIQATTTQPTANDDALNKTLTY
ncbi:MAG: tetratricopeptide repeat protein [Gammaproteobacteria bacterium]